jgi:hypothetical protein
VREEATLDQLDHAFRSPRSPAGNVVERIRQWATQDAADLEPELQRRAEAQKTAAVRQLLAVGEAEARSLRRLLEGQHARVAKADAEPDDEQFLPLPELQAEAEQRRRDRRHWKTKLEKLTTEIEQEPERVRQAYSVAADRLETIGLVYLWPETN